MKLKGEDSLEVQEYSGAQNVFFIQLNKKKELATPNLTPKYKVYGERLVEIEGTEYRVWDPNRSKLAAALLKGLKPLRLESGDKVLYLGAAAGTTASHISDIVGRDGVVYCVEFAPRMMRELLPVCEQRKNMIPILADATKPAEYGFLAEETNFIYQDVAQPRQAEIFEENVEVFLRKGSAGFLAVKARSIDVTQEPQEIFEKEVAVLRRAGIVIERMDILEPYHKDHAAIYIRH